MRWLFETALFSEAWRPFSSQWETFSVTTHQLHLHCCKAHLWFLAVLCPHSWDRWYFCILRAYTQFRLIGRGFLQCANKGFSRFLFDIFFLADWISLPHAAALPLSSGSECNAGSHLHSSVICAKPLSRLCSVPWLLCPGWWLCTSNTWFWPSQQSLSLLNLNHIQLLNLSPCLPATADSLCSPSVRLPTVFHSDSNLGYPKSLLFWD